MGIEPTEPAFDTGPNGFEDRGRHQTSKHFPRQFRTKKLRPVEASVFYDTFGKVANEPADDIPAFWPPHFNIAMLIDSNNAGVVDASCGKLRFVHLVTGKK